MSTHVTKSAAFSYIIVAAVLLTFASPVFAQRDAGSKARGDSTPFQVGERVEVSAPETRIMKGTQTVGTIKQGQIVEVRKIKGPWLGIEVISDGKELSGWIWNQQVTLARQPSAVSTEHVPTQPQVQRRSFSYEPSPQSYRGSGSPKKEPWQYQKTDPRRYRH